VFGHEFPYEARSTRGAIDRTLLLHLAPEFVADFAGSTLVKVVFDPVVGEVSAPVDPSDPDAWSSIWRLGYRGTDGWTHTARVHTAASSYDSDALYTVTFQIDDAAFVGAEGEPDLAIEYVDGEHPAVLMVRVLRTDRP
jgi:hypothetical protein